MTANKFLRENLLLVISIALPLLVVIFFLLAVWLPPLWTAPPQYDFLFSTSSRNQVKQVRMEFDVVNEKLFMRFYKFNDSYYTIPTLYRYAYKNGAISEIFINLPTDLDNLKDGQTKLVEAFAKQRISTNNKAPDGYVFAIQQSSDNIFNLFPGRQRPQYVLKKHGNIIAMPSDNIPYTYDLRFIGWLID